MNTKLISMLHNTKSFLVVLIAALVVGGGLGAVFALGTNPSQVGGSTVGQDDLLAARKQLQEQPAWGFISRYGRTGRVQVIEAKGKTVIVSTPLGSLHAKAGDSTSIRKSNSDEALAFEDLKNGMLVTVSGAEGQSGAIDASEILVIDDGEGGIDIRPASGEGPTMLPVFP